MKNEKRIVLVFPPKVHPTYIPFGITSIAAYLNRHVPCIEPVVLDLNIEVWNHYAHTTNDVYDFRSILLHRDEAFFNETDYRTRIHPFIHRVSKECGRLLLDAADYCDTGRESEEFKAVTERHLKQIAGCKPRFVGFSVMYYSQLIYSIALAKKIRTLNTNGDPGIIMGGAAMSALSSDDILLACNWIDVVFTGEAEIGIAAYCQNRPLATIPGIVYRAEGRIIRSSYQVTLSLKTLPVQDFSGLIHTGGYANPVPVLPVQLSRSCRWRKCRFCAHNHSFSGYRIKDIGNFTGELESHIEKNGARHFYFTDQYIDTHDLHRLADALLYKNLPIFFHFMGRPSADYSYDLFQKLYRAGCRWISWGVESGSQRLLDTANKGTSARHIAAVLQQSHEAGINNLCMMIFGLPGGTDEDLELTFEFIGRAAPYTDRFTESGFVLYKNTPFAANARAYGLIIDGREVLCAVSGRTIRSNRLFYREVSRTGVPRKPRTHHELSLWETRKKWMPAPSIYEILPAEHYLLYASRSRGYSLDQVILDNQVHQTRLRSIAEYGASVSSDCG
ncbi:MAG: radical SAM protein [Spirochaetales bacterium]|nr:radical SAM protein [Spirochaetales bacterium]